MGQLAVFWRFMLDNNNTGSESNRPHNQGLVSSQYWVECEETNPAGFLSPAELSSPFGTGSNTFRARRLNLIPKVLSPVHSFGHHRFLSLESTAPLFSGGGIALCEVACFILACRQDWTQLHFCKVATVICSPKFQDLSPLLL